MKEINIYEKHKENLCSIKFTKEDQYERNIDIINQLKVYFKLSNSLLVKARRPIPVNVQYILVNLKEKERKMKITELKIDDDLSEVSFSLFSFNLNDELTNLLATIWLEFEQPTFSCLVDEERLNAEKKIIEQNLSWKEITEFFNCYVIFKSVEENVIWLGKSEKLKFIN